MNYRRDLYLCGRKHCSKCHRWRHVYEYARVPEKPGLLRARCRTCERIDGRIYHGVKARGRAYGQQGGQETCCRGHALVGPEADVLIRSDGSRQCRPCRRLRERSPEYVEAHRIRQEGERRARGIPRRNLKRQTPYQGKVSVPVGPFADWLRDLAPVEELPRLTGLPSRRIYSCIHREYPMVHVDLVDEALMRQGETFLWELYPDLYP